MPVACMPHVCCVMPASSLQVGPAPRSLLAAAAAPPSATHTHRVPKSIVLSYCIIAPCPRLPRCCRPLQGFNDQLQKSAIQVASSGRVTDLDEPSWDLLDRQMRYGSNEMAIPITSIPMIIFKEMWHPFYVFQYFAVIIWIVGGWHSLAGLDAGRLQAHCLLLCITVTWSYGCVAGVVQQTACS